MGTSCGALEIIESKDEASSLYHHPKGSRPASIRLRTGKKGSRSAGHSVEDDLNKLIAVIDVRTSSRSYSPPLMDVQTTKKNTIKGPVTDSDSQARGADISESVTLKQALRRLCISHASEMAAAKRLSKGSGPHEAGIIKRLYASLVVQSNKSGFLQSEGKTNIVEISLLSEKNAFQSSQRATESCPMSIMDSSNKFGSSSPHGPISTPLCASKTRIKDVIAPKKLGLSSSAEDVKEETNSKGSNSVSRSVSHLRSWKVYPRSIRLAFRNKTSSKRKGKQQLVSAPATPGKISKHDKAGGVSRKLRFARRKGYFSSPFSTTNSRCRIGLKAEESNKSKGDSTPDGNDGSTIAKVNESSRSKVIGECSQSSNSSTGDYSCSTSISYDSHHSNSSANGCRPHMSKDVRWVAIRRIVSQQGSLNLRNFKLLKKLGCGDIGTVYLAQLSGAEHLFALKIMDIEYLISRKKILRAETEKDILNILDHPFLPTLYAHFTTDNLACLVMEYCSGGDLHVLRQRQSARRFSETAARFYVAEVLLALEYLHMLGIIYRDLKPENVLVREDGHIMLSDFDLSLRCSVSPTILTPSSQSGFQEPAKKHAGPCAENSCIHPFCIQPSWVPSSCLTPCHISPSSKSKPDAQLCQLPQLVAEPTDARSNSFVGTHEYLAPEIIRGDGHGSAVDWWTLGIFLFELLYGRTPFKGQRNDETLANIISESLWFPENPAVSCNARDLIAGLVAKEPENRLGFLRGAAEIKQHPFFQGTNWALIRSSAPPVTPLDTSKKVKCLDFRNNGEDGEFKSF